MKQPNQLVLSTDAAYSKSETLFHVVLIALSVAISTSVPGPHAIAAAYVRQVEADPSNNDEPSSLLKLPPANKQPKRPLLAWSFYGPDATFWVRAVTDSKTCPSLKVDGKAMGMSPRSTKEDSSLFAIEVCEAQISPQATQIEVNGQSVPAPAPAATGPKKIVVLGDTGCQIKIKGSGNKKKIKYQACNDSAKWPFAQIAQAASLERADLVVHVGDYHYREAPCPKGAAECAGSSFGDQWETWRQDFFAPAAPLLKASPWVFARGNHELCERGGHGWMRLLDPRSSGADCANQTDPYRIKLGSVSLAVIDAAMPENVNQSLKKLAESPQDGEWVILHRPLLTLGADEDQMRGYSVPSELLAPGKLSLSLVGHQHRLSLNQFADGRPPEFISGNGGTLLEKPESAADNEAGTPAQPHPGLVTRLDYGFLVLTQRTESSWHVSARDVSGKEVAGCMLFQPSGKRAKLSCGATRVE